MPASRVHVETVIGRSPAMVLVDKDAVQGYPMAMCALNVMPPSETRWLVRGLLLGGEPAVITGESGTMKTGLTLAIAAAVAGGHVALDRFIVPEARPVLIVSEEDPKEILVQRLTALAKGHSWDLRGVLKNVHLLARTGLSLDEKRATDHVRNEVKRLGAGLVVFDPWAELLGGLEESSNSQVRPVIKFTRSLTDLDATPLTVAHMGKAVEGKRAVDRVRGASALIAASRNAYALEPLANGDVRVECLKASRTRKPAPFSVHPVIQVDRGDEGIWTAATFTVVAVSRQAADFILETLRNESGLTTTQLKEAGTAMHLSGQDVSIALKALQEAHSIAFDSGEFNRKHWRLT